MSYVCFGNADKIGKQWTEEIGLPTPTPGPPKPPFQTNLSLYPLSYID